MPAQARKPARFRWRVAGIFINNFYNSRDPSITALDHVNNIFTSLNLLKQVFNIQLQTIIVVAIVPKLPDFRDYDSSGEHDSCS